jgi:hypothetical protein
MAGLLDSIIGVGKRTYDTLVGNDLDTRVRRHSGSESMLWTLIRTSNRTMSSRVKTSEHSRTTAHGRRGTPHLGFGQLVQPDKLSTVQNTPTRPNVFARDPRQTQHQSRHRDSMP